MIFFLLTPMKGVLDLLLVHGAAESRSAAAILFGNSMCRLVADGIEVSPSKSFRLLGQFTGVKIEFKEAAHCWRLVKLGQLVIARYAETAFQLAAAKLRDANRTAFSDMLDPAAFKQMLSQRRSKGAGEMIASFAPIEALPGKNATRFSEGTSIYSQLGKPVRSFLSELIISTHFSQES
jgi:hypothetical protein